MFVDRFGDFLHCRQIGIVLKMPLGDGNRNPPGMLDGNISSCGSGTQYIVNTYSYDIKGRLLTKTW